MCGSRLGRQPRSTGIPGTLESSRPSACAVRPRHVAAALIQTVHRLTDSRSFTVPEAGDEAGTGAPWRTRPAGLGSPAGRFRSVALPSPTRSPALAPVHREPGRVLGPERAEDHPGRHRPLSACTPPSGAPDSSSRHHKKTWPERERRAPLKTGSTPTHAAEEPAALPKTTRNCLTVRLGSGS